jgi:quinol monooxygenase YgiN
MFFRLNTMRTTPPGRDKVAGPRKFYGNARARLSMFLRFARFRFKDGKEGDGLRILHGHAAAIRAGPGCRGAWLGQGQHPATECVVIALFEDEDSLRRLEGRLRSDPTRGADFFALLPLTTAPPEVTSYEVRAGP